MHGTNFTSQRRDIEAVDWSAYKSEYEFVDAFVKQQDAYLTFISVGASGKDKPLEVFSYRPDEATPETIERVDLIYKTPSEAQLHAANAPDPSADPLLVAIKAGDNEAVAAALNGGADVNAMPPGSNTSYLGYAIGQERIGPGDGLVDQLLAAGADPTYNGETPNLVQLVPSLFASPNNMRMMAKLLQAGADVNASRTAKRKNIFIPGGQTPLITAAQTGQLTFVQFLLRHGADPHLVDSTGKTALDYAKNWQREIRKDLLNEVPSFAEEGDSERIKAVIALLKSAVEGTLDLKSLPSDEELIAAEEACKKAED